MGYIEKHEITTLGLACDTRNCDAQYMTGFTATGNSDDRPRMERDDRPRVEREAAALGWTFWVARGRRVYCPDHKPRPGGKAWHHDVLKAYPWKSAQ